MVIGTFIFQELKISNSCYMAAAIQFSILLATQIMPCFTSSQDHSSPTQNLMPSQTSSSGESRPYYSSCAGGPSRNVSSQSSETQKTTVVCVSICRIIGEEEVLLDIRLLPGHRGLLPIYELLTILQVELFQQNSQPGFWLPSLRPFLQVHGGTSNIRQLIVEIE